jgi:DNA replication and repair protein RecF
LELGLVLVTGPNGAGKTNLLESLHLATQGFSPRSRRDADLIRFGADAARVEIAGRRGRNDVNVRIDLSVAAARRATLNGAPLASADALRRELQTLVFTPDRLAIVKGGPAARRAYFDRVLARLHPARSPLPADYAAAVAQRNAALRFSSEAAVEPWTEQVADLGSELVAARREVVSVLEPAFAARATELGLEDARLVYEGELPTRSELDARFARDRERGTTSVGPHLHDIRLTSGERDLRSFGSQGEQRLTVLALLLAEAELLTEQRGAAPLVLLDDVLSELDPQRRAILAARVAEYGQAVVTATDPSFLPISPAQHLEVSPGAVRAA